MSGEPRPASSSDAIDRPIFIVSTPRSGSTLLFDQLAQAPDVYAVHGESHSIIEGLAELGPAAHDWHSNRLTSDDATSRMVAALSQRFYRALKNRDGHGASGRVRMLEKTPKNALRVPFFAAAFPDSRFLYLYRDPRESLASMMEAWASGYFRTYPDLPGWTGYPWSLLLVPGWRELIGKPLPEIVAHQWQATTETLLDDLEDLPRDRVESGSYADLLADPQGEVERLAGRLGLGWDRTIGPNLPLSKVTVSPPRSDKWRRLEPMIEAVMSIVAKADERARAFLAART